MAQDLDRNSREWYLGELILFFSPWSLKLWCLGGLICSFHISLGNGKWKWKRIKWNAMIRHEMVRYKMITYEMIFLMCMKRVYLEKCLKYIWSKTMLCYEWKYFSYKCLKYFGSQTHVTHETFLSYVSLFNVMYHMLYSRRKMIDGSRGYEIQNGVELFKVLMYFIDVNLICLLWFVWCLMVTPNVLIVNVL